MIAPGQPIQRYIEPVQMNTTEPYLDEFTHYIEFPPELRHHVLTFAGNAELFNYAQCSQICNLEVQRFNTRAPVHLILKNSKYKKVTVEFGYMPKHQLRRVKKTFPNNKTGVKPMKQFIEQQLKFTKCGPITVKLEHFRKWPTDIMEIKKLSRISILCVTWHLSIYDELVKYLERSNILLLFFRNGKERKAIPSDFKDRPFFKNIGYCCTKALKAPRKRSS